MFIRLVIYIIALAFVVGKSFGDDCSSSFHFDFEDFIVGKTETIELQKIYGYPKIIQDEEMHGIQYICYSNGEYILQITEDKYNSPGIVDTVSFGKNVRFSDSDHCLQSSIKIIKSKSGITIGDANPGKFISEYCFKQVSDRLVYSNEYVEDNLSINEFVSLEYIEGTLEYFSVSYSSELYE